MAEERFITSQLNRREESFETSLRPRTFDEFPGQDRVKERLQIIVQAAIEREEPLAIFSSVDLPAWGRPPLPTLWP